MSMKSIILIVVSIFSLNAFAWASFEIQSATCYTEDKKQAAVVLLNQDIGYLFLDGIVDQTEVYKVVEKTNAFPTTVKLESDHAEWYFSVAADMKQDQFGTWNGTSVVSLLKHKDRNGAAIKMNCTYGVSL